MVILVTTFQFFANKKSMKVVKFTTNMEANFEGIFFNSSQCATHVDGLEVSLLGGY